MTLMLMSADEMAAHIAKSAKARRLSLNFSQKSLSARSGVSLGVIKKFERTGKISLGSMLKLALALGSLEDFKEVFKLPAPEQLATLDEVLKEDTRKRGRK